MSDKDKYGFYGEGTEGYVHYMQGVDEANRVKSSHTSVPAKRTQVRTSETGQDKARKNKNIRIAKVEFFLFIIFFILAVFVEFESPIWKVIFVGLTLLTALSIAIIIWIDTKYPHS